MRNVRMPRPYGLGIMAAALFTTPLQADAQSDWCGDEDRENRHCEVREFTLRGDGSLEVDAKPNGGVEVVGWDRNEVRVLAKVVSRGRSEARAQELVSAITIETGGTIRADGPKAERNESWSVSYRISVPRNTDLELSSTNGGVGVEGVRGTMELQTTNGGISLRDLGGDVSARTTNGGLSVELSGSRWDGGGLEAVTTNGAVVLSIPEGYSAQLESGTRNGGFDIEFPMTVSGRISRTLSTEIGSGGAPISVRTTNGGVRIQRAP
ncbi:MAG: DUF4097 domain-containing protein [Gemmatimonadota bacterium]|nr:DUF4097 domain-containing protein [Gemmatimonadota bacterium]